MRIAWWIGALLGAVAPAGGCLALTLVIPTPHDAIDGSGMIAIEMHGSPIMFEPTRCVSGLHEDWVGATLLDAAGWQLDLVDESDRGITAYLRGPGLDGELALDRDHCTKRELRVHRESDPDSDSDKDYDSGELEVTCVFDRARIRGKLAFKKCD